MVSEQVDLLLIALSNLLLQYRKAYSGYTVLGDSAAVHVRLCGVSMTVS